MFETTTQDTFFLGIPRTDFPHHFFGDFPNWAGFYGSAPNLQTHQRPKGATMSMRTLWWAAGFLVGGWVPNPGNLDIFPSPKKGENKQIFETTT